jgi:hypothetical protein
MDMAVTSSGEWLWLGMMAFEWVAEEDAMLGLMAFKWAAEERRMLVVMAFEGSAAL